MRRQAAEALRFDADGWLDGDERQRRHDEMITEAEGLEAAAADPH